MVQIIPTLPFQNSAEQEACRADPRTSKNLQNEIPASLQSSTAGGGLAEISIDRSQKVGAEFYGCEISPQNSKGVTEMSAAGADQMPARALLPKQLN